MTADTIALSPGLATVIFCVTCWAGYRYRSVWKAEGPRLHYWIFGLIAASGLLVLGLIPLDLPAGLPGQP